MTDHIGAGNAGFLTGSVISRGIAVYFRNFVPLLPIGAVAVLPTAASNLALQSGFVLGGLLFSILDFIGFCWLSAGVTYCVVSDLRGNRASAGELFGRSLACLPRLFVFFLIVGLLAVLIGLVMFVPLLGVAIAWALYAWLYTVYWVALPSIVVERIGPVAGLNRSELLTKGYRWKVLGIVIVWYVALFLVGTLAELLAGTLAELIGSTATGVTASVLDTILLGLGASIAAVGYHDLRLVKEGVGSEEIARVFD